MELTDFPTHSPYSRSGASVVEFTVKAVVLGIVLSAIMTAANVYLGLKAGMTVSASIPAAVISMGILRGIMRKGTILENNMVQTIASAGESLAAGIIFTIPGLILTGVWSHFHYWTVSLVALLGGVLGIMFMIPLRRTLIVEEVELKYPEGVACAKVLEAGQKGGRGVIYLFLAMGVGALITWFIKGIALFSGSVEWGVRVAKSAIGFGLDISSALIGVGYIVGFNIALLVFIGGAIAWFVAIPLGCPAQWQFGEAYSLTIERAAFISLDKRKAIYHKDGEATAIAADLWADPGGREIYEGEHAKLAPVKDKTFGEMGSVPEEIAWKGLLEKHEIVGGATFLAKSSTGKIYKLGIEKVSKNSIKMVFAGEAAAFNVASDVWNSQIRFMGIGAMVIGGLWSIFKMRRSFLKGIRDAFSGYSKIEAAEDRKPRTETDMPIRSIVIITVAMVIGIFILYSIVTRSYKVTTRGGSSIIVLQEGKKAAKKEEKKRDVQEVKAKKVEEKKSVYPAYGIVPLTSRKDKWQVEGVVYETINRAYVIDTGISEKEIEFSIPPRPGDRIKFLEGKRKPLKELSSGDKLAITRTTTAGNQVFSGVVVRAAKESFKLKVPLRVVRQIPADRIKEQKEAGPDGKVTFVTVDDELLTGKLLPQWNGATHILSNEGHRFILTKPEKVANYRFGMSLVSLIAMIAAGFFFVAVASYISGLVGSSNNPVSGMIICTVLFTSGLLLLFGFTGNLGIIAVLGVAGIVCCAAATGADVSQDLKTGWLVKATPAKQQYGQIIGVAASAFLIAPVLGMLHNAYTIGSKELAAPQAGMFASIVDKIFRHKPFPWGMAMAGACVAVVLIVIDEILRKKKSAFRTHVMPVAIGIYLPITLAVPILIGGLVNLGVGRLKRGDKDTQAAAIHRGILFCAGLIAGEAILGIVIGGMKVSFDLPFKIWKEGVEVFPDLVSIGAVVLIVALVFVVSLVGNKEKAS